MSDVSSFIKKDSCFAARDFALVACVIIATLMVLGKDISVGGLRDGDSSAHAMDGVLILDWIGAGPRAWLRPMEFALEQYSRYPTLAIGRHYPPGFAVVEAAFFALFGISAITARMTVVFFGCAAAVGAYVFMRAFAGRMSAVLTAIVLVTMPLFVHWGRQEMLEVPTLAVMIWSAIAILSYVQNPSRRQLAWMLASLLLCLFFRQTALCLFAAAAVLCMLPAVKGRIPRMHVVLVVLLAVGASLIVVGSLDGHGKKLLRGDPTHAFMGIIFHVTFYVRQLPWQVGMATLTLAIIGAWYMRRRAPWPAGLLGLWLIAGYAMLTIPDYKNPRFAFVLLFPFAAWAAFGVERLLSARLFVRVRSPVAVAIGLGLIGGALALPVEHRPDYGPVVLAHRERIENKFVFYSGLREGDFVFAVRQHLLPGRGGVVRASKLLYTCNGRPDLDYLSLVQSTSHVDELMNRYAFATVVVERENKIGVVEEDWLRDYLDRSGSYELAATHPLPAGDEPSFRDVVIDVYHAAPGLRRTADHFTLPLARINQSVRVSLAD